MPSETIHAAAMIVHNNGSEEVENFARVEEVLTNETTEVHVWYDKHSGDPDKTYHNGAIVSITQSTTETDTYSETIHAAAMIVHNNGSEEVENFAHIEEVLANETTEVHVWYDKHSGDPDKTYHNGTIVSITQSTTESVSEGDRFPDELSTCAVCGSNQLTVIEINKYSLDTLTQDVRCVSCGAEYTEGYEIVKTVLTNIPDM